MERNDRFVFEHIDDLNESISEDTTMDVDVFFDFIEEMVENNYKRFGEDGYNQEKGNGQNKTIL